VRARRRRRGWITGCLVDRILRGALPDYMTETGA
jgi:hypothetical protein